MTQIQHLVGVVGQLAQQQQHQQMQWQQQGVQQNPAVIPPGLGPHGRARKLIDTRFVKIPFFPGEGKDYEDWSFAFKRAMRAANRTTYDILATVEKAGLEIGDEELAEQFAEEDVQGHSAEIYDVLCQYVGGEALQLVRTVDDMEGFRAWSKLYRKYAPKTLARAIRMVGQVTNPPKVKELRDVERELMKWEEKAKALTKEFGETFGDTVKVGIVVSIMPQAVQELVYQSIGDKLDYDEVTAKIRSVVSNKVAMMEGPTPMDVGKIDHECESENLEDDVAAVSWSTQCLGCGGWGHLRRECPSVVNDGKGGKAWGKGLGEKGKGKGHPPRDRRATAGASRDPEREDSRDPAFAVASRGTERTSAGTTPRTPSRKRMRRRPCPLEESGWLGPWTSARMRTLGSWSRTSGWQRASKRSKTWRSGIGSRCSRWKQTRTGR